MSLGANASLAAGARLLAQRKAVIVWVYAAFLGFTGAAWMAANAVIAPITGFSLYSQRLAGGFDLIAFFELLGRQDVSVGPLVARSMLSLIGLAIVLWFCAAGIMAEFLSPAKLGPERFFQTCGAYWWRFVRLILLTWVILLPTMGILSAIRGGLVDAADKSFHVRLPFVVFVSFSVVMQVILMILRGWFDTAEFDLLHYNRPKSRRALGEARRLTRGCRLNLLWIYLVPAVLMWVVALFFFWLWVKSPAGTVGLGFLLSQAMILALITGRMWQRASQGCWFLAHAPVLVELPAVETVAAVEAPPVPAPEPLPEPTEPEINLP